MTTEVRGSSRKEKGLTVSLACMGRELQEKIQMLDQTRVIVREHPDHGQKQQGAPWFPLKTTNEI